MRSRSAKRVASARVYSPRAAAWRARIAAIACLLSGVAVSQGSGIDEDQVKAMFLVRMTRFVEWPPGSFTSADAPFSICVVADPAFGDLLEQVVKRIPPGERATSVRRLHAAGEARGCHILYFGASERRRIRMALEAAGDAGFLTAGATEGFTVQGCVLDFWVEAERLRFKVNLPAAARAQLRFSSKLLALAASVVKE